MSLPVLQRRRARRVRDDMIPMINIVFLLQIFFMVAGQLTGFDETLVLPMSNGEGERPSRRIVVSLHSDDRVLIDGVPLVGSLTVALAELSLTGNDTLVVHAHHELPAGALDPLLVSLPSIGVDGLQLVTRKAP